MGLMKELNDLNNIYQKMYDVDEAMELTNADRKANTPAWQNRDKKHPKTGKPIYKLAGHLTAKVRQPKKGDAPKGSKMKEDYETKKKSEVLGAMKKQGRKLSDKEKSKIADKVVKDKGDTSKSDDRYAYESITPEVERLIESGKFSAKEIANIADIQESDIAAILARLEKKRISKGGDPEESPLPAMRKYHADKKKKKVKEDYWNEFEEGYQRNPEKGEEEERKRSQRVRGERTPMPPRGDKKREEFERWYAANVR